jgi:hypothetical protein
MFAKFGDPAQNMPDKHVIDGLLNTLRLFTLPEGEAANPFQRYHRDDLVKFLLPRSKDYRTILYYYPGETTPRVRLVNSLDRLELVVINADLQFMLPDNFGLKFLAVLAEAYGDEPYESWPEELQRRYPRGSGKRPLTLKEAYQQMEKTENLFSKLVGFPKLEECSPGDGPAYDPADPADRPYETKLRMPALSGAPEWLVPFDIKAHVFNIAQVLPVLKENLPGSNGTPESAGGLRIIRDLLWEIYSSTPPQYRNPRAGERNNLKIAIKLVRLGLLRQVARQIRQFELDDPSMNDFFRSFIEGADTPQIGDIFHEVLMRHRDHKLIWALMDVLQDIAEKPDDVAYLKQLAFYLIGGANPESMGLPADRPLIQPVLANIDLAIRNHYDFLAANADLAADVLKSRQLSRSVRAFYEDPTNADKVRFSNLLVDVLEDDHRVDDLLTLAQAVNDDAGAHDGWNLFRDRMDAMTRQDGYQQLDLSEIGKDVLHFFEEVPSPAQPQTAADLREYLGRVLASHGGGASPGEIEELLDLAARKPDQVYQVLEMLSHYTENGELKDFVKLARRSLSEPPR